MDTVTLLRKHHVSLVEYYVMCVVGYHIYLPVDELAHHSMKLSEGDRDGEFPLEDHVMAVQSCLAKAWMEILTPEEYEQMVARRQEATLPELFDDPQPHTVSFTQTGYLLFRQILFERFGRQHLEYKDSGWNWDEKQKVAHMYAETREYCQKRMKEFTCDVSLCVGETAEVTHISPVEEIGPWRPNRFLVLPHGFHAWVSYQVKNVSL